MSGVLRLSRLSLRELIVPPQYEVGEKGPRCSTWAQVGCTAAMLRNIGDRRETSCAIRGVKDWAVGKNRQLQ